MNRVLNLVLAVALAITGFFAWQMLRGGPASAPGGAAVAPGGTASAPDGGLLRRWLPGACRTCGGTRQIACPVCTGTGEVERVDRIPCHQCGGSKRYAPRKGGRDAPCPFCSAKGYTEKTNRVACTTCNGTGKRPCPECAGPK